MSEELQKTNIQQIASKLPIPVDKAINIAYQSAKGIINSPEDIAKLYCMSELSALQLILNPVFATLIHNISIAIQKYRFDAIALKQILDIIQYSTEEKNKISATKVAADIMGLNSSKNKPQVNVTMNFDSMIRNITDSTFPGM